MKALSFRIVATTKHGVPYAVFWRTPFSVPKIDKVGNIPQ
jgi:hypothetical protein